MTKINRNESGDAKLYRPLSIVQFSTDAFSEQSRDVVEEVPIVVEVQPTGTTLSTMASPSQIEDWVVGHLFSERLIETAAQVRLPLIEMDDHQCRVQAEIIESPSKKSADDGSSGDDEAVPLKAFSISSSGERSVRSVASTIRSIQPVDDGLRVDADAVFRAMDGMHALQEVHRRTRGTHAMALARPDGSIYSFSEDVGRHNALDKVIGRCLINGDKPSGLFAVMSSRVSLEMLCKAARAGIELVTAIGCPTTLAIKVGQQANVTIAGRVRDREITIYTHHRRIVHQGHET